MIPQTGKKTSKHKPRTFNALAWFGTNAPKTSVSPSRSMVKSHRRRSRRMVISKAVYPFHQDWVPRYLLNAALYSQ